MDSKNKWLSRTVWLGVITVAIGILELVAEFLASGDFSPPAITLIVSGALGVVLRFLTSQPIK